MGAPARARRPSRDGAQGSSWSVLLPRWAEEDAREGGGHDAGRGRAKVGRVQPGAARAGCGWLGRRGRGLGPGLQPLVLAAQGGVLLRRGDRPRGRAARGRLPGAGGRPGDERRRWPADVPGGAPRGARLGVLRRRALPRRSLQSARGGARPSRRPAAPPRHRRRRDRDRARRRRARSVPAGLDAAPLARARRGGRRVRRHRRARPHAGGRRLADAGRLPRDRRARPRSRARDGARGGRALPAVGLRQARAVGEPRRRSRRRRSGGLARARWRGGSAPRSWSSRWRIAARGSPSTICSRSAPAAGGWWTTSASPRRRCSASRSPSCVRAHSSSTRGSACRAGRAP